MGKTFSEIHAQEESTYDQNTYDGFVPISIPTTATGGAPKKEETTDKALTFQEILNQKMKEKNVKLT